MTETEFGEMRIGTFFLKLHFFIQKREEEQKFTAELIRLQTWHLLNIQIQVEKRIKKPEDLWNYKWDKTEKNDNSSQSLTEEESKENLQRLMRAATWLKD